MRAQRGYMRKWPALVAALILPACASFPELGGQSVAPLGAADFQIAQDSDAPVWELDFGDAALRVMLAQADAKGLDAAAARVRLRAADLALEQVRAARALGPVADFGAGEGGLSLSASVRFEPDLAGRFDAAMRAALLDRRISGLDFVIARRTLARSTAQGWVALALARLDGLRAAEVIEGEQKAVELLRLRNRAGQSTGAELAAREQALIRAQGAVVSTTSAIALAEARLRALGVQTIPASISLQSARLPSLPARLDLTATEGSAPVCSAWVRLRSAGAARAEALAAARPRLVLTSSLSATAASLAGLIAGNAAALSSSVRLEGAILDNGQSRRTVEGARLSRAQAEIDWLQARAAAEIAALEAIAARQTAQASLDAAQAAALSAQADLDRAIARHAAGLIDALGLAEARSGLATARLDVQRAKGDALLTAITAHDVLPSALAGCSAVGDLP
jgi:outer membrane protein, multidrug efflux system